MDIQAAIPHRPPMLLVDEVLQCDARSITCRKRFEHDEFFFQGHYPGRPIVPGVILCEAGMQAGAILLSQFLKDHENENKVPVATRLNDVRFKRIVQPGDTVTMEVTLTERMASAFFLRAKLTVEKKVAVRFEFACTLADMTSQNSAT